MSHFNFGIFYQVLSYKNGLSGNTFWKQASGFGIFNEFVYSVYSKRMLNETFSVIFKHGV